ncbi:hypothetical protein BCR15_05120 [Tessaracoccus lapidicaptus]|uniref:Uncharacterized protein n=1 Tax=Tessaracoccus lapidicaptus TaxID=1427523 RepID=A0A1C0AKN0_9ACTN|nr:MULTISPECIES: hypothetical protein [Tessaracoccus]AQX15916.1 hypothetical protein BKM78_08315 [Tessaracoccus sp. T2.5-30]OCL33217.1 hypothetical protein BCR15_05120 [Tessaracoccus lapidicaptus]VEP40392.1 hypothetical protein TLA_TLA_01677 [Tessaracoccus lapidicaptus]
MSIRQAGRAAGRILLAGATGFAAITATTATASASPEERAGVFKLTFAGYAAMAAWTTCPDLESEEVGTICTGADVMAFYSAGSEQAGSEFHLHDQRSGVVKTFDYTCVVADVEWDPGVVERTCLGQSERFGRATDAEVAVDPRLNAVDATATVPVQIVDFLADSQTSGSLDVAATFTGTGPTRRIDERAHWADRYVMWLEGTRGWERDCTASAVFDGVAVPGELVMCSLSRVRQAEVRVYHNTPSEG